MSNDSVIVITLRLKAGKFSWAEVGSKSSKREEESNNAVL